MLSSEQIKWIKTEECYYVMVNGSIFQTDRVILNLYSSNHWAVKHLKWNWQKLKEKSTFMVEGINSHLSKTVLKKIIQKLRKEQEKLNHTISQWNIKITNRSSTKHENTLGFQNPAKHTQIQHLICNRSLHSCVAVSSLWWTKALRDTVFSRDLFSRRPKQGCAVS